MDVRLSIMCMFERKRQYFKITIFGKQFIYTIYFIRNINNLVLL